MYSKLALHYIQHCYKSVSVVRLLESNLVLAAASVVCSDVWTAESTWRCGLSYWENQAGKQQPQTRRTTSLWTMWTQVSARCEYFHHTLTLVWLTCGISNAFTVTACPADAAVGLLSVSELCDICLFSLQKEGGQRLHVCVSVCLCVCKIIPKVMKRFWWFFGGVGRGPMTS